MKYSIYAALREDVNSGWVWISVPKFRQREVICVKNVALDKKIYCEVLQIDDNYLNYYNAKGQGRKAIKKDASVLVMNEWYRNLLGDLPTQSEYEFQVSEAGNWHGRIMSCFQHPQIIVRVATWLGVISVVLGVVGVLLGIISLCV
jgi:hypothetical protein